MARVKLEPCIYDAGGGRFLVRVKLPNGKDVTRTFDGIRNARAWRDAQRSDRARGTVVDPAAGKITFETYANTWLENKATKAHNTKTLVRRSLEIHAFPYIGSKRMAAIRRSDVQGIVNRMNQTLQPVTVRNYHGHLSAVFTSAVLDGIIVDTPCKEIALPENRKGPHSVVPLLPRHVTHIAEHMTDEWVAAVAMAVGTGLRPGELFALTTDRVDFLRGTVSVDRQVQTAKGGVYLCHPKSKSSKRVVPLSPATIELVGRLMQSRPPVTMTLPFGAPLPPGTPDERPRVEGDFLFGQRMFTRHNLVQAWQAATEGIDHELPDRSGWHALRHFYASVLIAGGENVLVVQARMGHESAKVTLDTYGHLMPDNEEKTRAVVDNAVASLFGDLVGTSPLGVPKRVVSNRHGASTGTWQF